MYIMTYLHQQRLEAVVSILQENPISSVLDLGCGEGFLVEKLADIPQFQKITAIDICEASLCAARKRIERRYNYIPDHIRIRAGSFMQADDDLCGFHAAVMLETIEHIDPDKLSTLENSVFGHICPDRVFITTPNKDYNTLLGVPETRMRHPDHRFEWGLQKFRIWCNGVAERNGYRSDFKDIGGVHPHFGGPTQMAVFNKKDMK